MDKSWSQWWLNQTKDVRDQDRGTIVPLGTNALGREVLALPGPIKDGADGLFALTDKYLSGREAEYNPQDAQSAFDFSSMLGLGSSVIPKPTNALGMFGGRKARTADQNALYDAQALIKGGSSPEDVWQKTGWFKRPSDGEWLHETKDLSKFQEQASQWKKAAEMKWRAYDKEYGPNVASHAGHLAHMGSGAAAGAYGTGALVPGFELPAFAGAVGGLLIPHVQQLKDFKKSVAEVDLRSKAGLTEDDLAAVQKRMNLTAAQRRARPPWLDYDVPINALGHQ